MAEGQMYDIPEIRLKWFQDKIAKLNKRSEKLVGESIFCTVIGYHFIEDGEGDKRLAKQKIYEVFIAHPPVKLNGWEFVARIDHSQETGNIIRSVPEKTVPERYRTSQPYCEHCNINRLRRDTFIVACEETNEYKQIGSSCLKDFMGHPDAEKLAKIAEWLAIIGDYSRGIGFERYSGLIDRRYVDSNYYLAHVAENIMRNGWISSKVAKDYNTTSTANFALANVMDNKEIGIEASALAERAIEWALTFNGDKMNDWEHHARVIAQSDALELRHLNIAASIVGVYWQKFEKPETIAKPVSKYVGNIKTKLVTPVKLTKITIGDFSSRHVFEDVHGNVLIWFASNASLNNLIDKEIVIQATVKNHQEFNGVKQTIINRVKVI